MDILHNQITANESDIHFDDVYGWTGEVLRGDRIVNTPYQLKMNQDKKCELACAKPGQPTKLSVADSKLIAERIQEEYYVHL